MECSQHTKMDRAGLKPLCYLFLAVEHRQITQLRSLRGLIGKARDYLIRIARSGWIPRIQLARRPAHGGQPVKVRVLRQLFLVMYV